MTEAAIEIKDLHFAYGKKQVLQGVNLEVPQGSIFGFLGRNGAGKTTTIKTLLGLQRPRSGQCTVNGLDSSCRATAAESARATSSRCRETECFVLFSTSTFTSEMASST